MRRLPALLLLAALAAGALLGTMILVRPIPVLRSGARFLAHARRPAVTALDWMTCSPARAQEVLEFKPVAPESLSSLDTSRRARRRASLSIPPVSGTGVAPSPAESTSTRRIVGGKSGNIMRAGSDIHIEQDQSVVGDVLAVGGDITIDGHVEGDAVAMGGDVYLNASSRVDGDVVCLGGELHEEEGASIGGQRVTAVGRDRDRESRRSHEAHERSVRASRQMVWLLITVLVAWAFAGLAPGRTRRAVETLKREPGAALLVGFLAIPSVFALVVVAVLLTITCIGAPIAAIAILAYFAIWVWGYVVGATALGERLAARLGPGAASLTRAALYGVLAIGGAWVVGRLLHLVPGLGAIGTLLSVFSWLAFSLATLIGLGAWLRNEFSSGWLSRMWGPKAVATPAPASPPASATAPPQGEPPAPPPGDPPAPPVQV